MPAPPVETERMKAIVLSAPKRVRDMFTQAEFREMFKKTYEREYKKRIKQIIK